MDSNSMISISPTTLFTIFAVCLALFLWISARSRRSSNHGGHDNRKFTIPEAGGSWPLIGHLHLLGGLRPPHVVLAGLADRYGPIFTIRLGVNRAIVVNTWEIAKECLTTHDRTFATRPTFTAGEIMGYNYAMIGFAPYGPYWRHIRKISTLELLSSHRLKLLNHVRESEVHASVKDLYGRWRNRVDDGTPTTLVDMKRWFKDITLNIIFRKVIGKRYNDGEGEDEKARRAMRDFFELSGLFVVSDGLPFLRWLDIGGHIKAMRRTAEELDRVIQGWLDEHKAAKRKLQCGDEGEKRHEDFMDVMLSMLKDNEEVDTYDADTVNKAVCMTMILGASDTITISLTWALSLLLNHKESLKKVQQELDTNIGRDMQVKESDLNNLPYLQAIIYETLRLYPAAPLGIPHEAIEDCTVDGHFVPKGTRLLLNLYKIQRDSRVWPDPDEFKPERFITTHKEIDVRGQNFELIPFGSGRRICPGISMALPLVGLSLASFLQAFEVQTPGDEPVDMTQAIAITNLKATPLEVLVKPRLPEFMYQ